MRIIHTSRPLKVETSAVSIAGDAICLFTQNSGQLDPPFRYLGSFLLFCISEDHTAKLMAKII
jgi:hypothetical protein